MNTWANAVITEKGLALQSKLTQRNTLTITKAVIGTGYVNPAILYKSTGVTNPKNNLAVRTISYPESGKCSMPLVMTNSGVETGYIARQIGIYAMDPDEGEILYFISQSTQEDGGTEVPSETEMPGYSAEWTFYFQYGQADNVTVTVDPANTINAEQAQRMIDASFEAITTEEIDQAISGWEG